MPLTNACYPTGQIRVGERIDIDCPHCGHCGYLHSIGRACVGCETLELITTTLDHQVQYLIEEAK